MDARTQPGALGPLHFASARAPGTAVPHYVAAHAGLSPTEQS